MVSLARTPETMADYLAWDHAQLDALLSDATLAVSDGEIERAEDVVRELRIRFLRHIRLEEQLVFPLLEGGATPVGGGPTAGMRHEHVRLQGELGDLADARARGDAAGYFEAQARLDGLMPAHVHKEEELVFPAADRGLSDGARRDLVARLRAG
jgi:iron-sulfur cluster repair protein YtfE (RIC family)